MGENRAESFILFFLFPVWEDIGRHVVTSVIFELDRDMTTGINSPSLKHGLRHSLCAVFAAVRATSVFADHALTLVMTMSSTPGRPCVTDFDSSRSAARRDKIVLAHMQICREAATFWK